MQDKYFPLKYRGWGVQGGGGGGEIERMITFEDLPFFALLRIVLHFGEKNQRLLVKMNTEQAPSSFYFLT